MSYSLQQMPMIAVQRRSVAYDLPDELQTIISPGLQFLPRSSTYCDCDSICHSRHTPIRTQRIQQDEEVDISTRIIVRMMTEGIRMMRSCAW